MQGIPPFESTVNSADEAGSERTSGELGKRILRQKQDNQLSRGAGRRSRLGEVGGQKGEGPRIERKGAGEEDANVRQRECSERKVKMKTRREGRGAER